MIEFKIAHGGLGLKDDGPEGSFTARIGELAPTVDHDADVVLPEAVPQGARTVVSKFNHSSVRGDVVPVGIATITHDGHELQADGRFFVETEEGRNTYTVLKALHEQGLGEWSWSFRVVDASQDRSALARYPGARRVLRSVVPKEVSPVFAGAGIGTRTLSMKCAGCEGGYGSAIDADADRYMSVDELAVVTRSSSVGYPWQERAEVEAAEVCPDLVDAKDRAVALEMAETCARQLAIATPRIRWFSKALGARGLAFQGRGEIWISTRTPWHEQPWVVAHEVKHMAQTTDDFAESDADRFADRAMDWLPDVRRFARC